VFILQDIDFENIRTKVNIDELAINARTAAAIFPSIKNTRINRCWAGIEGMVEDSIPIISQSQTHPNTYHVFGFSAHGFQLGPITGTIIRDLALTGKTSLPVQGFSIARFN
jgi:sarcosine oxidase subunit beta